MSNAGTLVPSRRELCTIRAIAQHGTIAAAASALGRSRHTLDAQLDRLRRKSGLRHLPQIVAWAARNGWLDEPRESPGGGSESCGQGAESPSKRAGRPVAQKE